MAKTRQLLRSPFGSASRGFSMIELLVALMVLSIGMLGIAALMVTSMRNAQSANQRTQAVNLAYEITDVIRANLNNAMYYHSVGFNDPATACTQATRPASTYPVASESYQLDLQRWARDLCYQLPNGRGNVTVTPSTAVVAATGAPYKTYAIAVSVCWDDVRDAAGASDCDNTTTGPDTVIQIESSL